MMRTEKRIGKMEVNEDVVMEGEEEFGVGRRLDGGLGLNDRQTHTDTTHEVVDESTHRSTGRRSIPSSVRESHNE